MVQAKRIQVNETNLGAGSQTDVNLDVPTSPREEVNFHNIWVSVSVEPQDTDANSQGTWVLWHRNPGIGTSLFTDVNINIENTNAQIIACGVYSASNQSPFNYETQIKTSRTLPAGAKLTLSCVVTGITAGLASCRVMLCAHTVRK